MLSIRPLIAAATLSAFTLVHTPVTSALTADAGFLGTPYRDGHCKSDLSYLNQVRGWQVSWPSEWQTTAQSGAADDYTAALARWGAAPAAIDEAIAYLSAEKPTYQKAPRQVVSRVLNQVQLLLASLGDDRSELLSHEDGHGDESTPWTRFLREDMHAAVQRFSEFLAEDYLPSTGDLPALANSPHASGCYESAVLWWTGLELSNHEIREIGQRLLREAQSDLASTLAPQQSVAELMHELRHVGDQKPVSRAELLALSESALNRAGEQAKAAFSAPINTNVMVEAMPGFMEDDAPAGFYRRGGPSAAYVINLSRPASRRLMAEVIAFHEGIPGHHLQFTYPTKQSGPFNYGFGEGWAIYAEYLADELGLYGSLLDRQGMMAKHLWAASRLVIEPNIQRGHWDREQAIAFMESTTTLARPEVEIEIDRYYAMPGQSLSYMLGYDTIARLRSRAEEVLGAQFDLKEFHNAVLEQGMQPLPKLATYVEEWMARF